MQTPPSDQLRFWASMATLNPPADLSELQRTMLRDAAGPVAATVYQ
jgi:hypothetical protein